MNISLLNPIQKMKKEIIEEKVRENLRKAFENPTKLNVNFPEKEKTLSEKREDLFFNGKLRECFKEGTILKKELERQDKQFIRKILDLSDLDNYRGYSNIEKIMNKIKQKSGDLI